MSEALPGMPEMPFEPAEPRLSAVAILWREGERGLEVCWLLRAKVLRFAGGFHAFPGGKVDPGDAQVPIAGASGSDAELRVAAARELFEEVGILAARGSGRPSDEERQALLDGKVTFAELLARHGRTLHAGDFLEAGRWVTPVWVPIRFDTHFFLVHAPADQPLTPWVGELAEGGWVPVAEALRRWEEGGVPLHPPQRHVLQVLARAPTDAPFPQEATLAALREGPGTADGLSPEIEFLPGLRVVPLRTATLPPATHTNCYVLGTGELLIVDPGTAEDAELARLEAQLARLARGGARPRAIVLTHHHGDHSAGAKALASRLGLPIWCHALTADRLDLEHARRLVDGEVLELAGPRPMRWHVLHTPGHAPGHVTLVDEASGAGVVGDMVAGMGTILIDPHEGDMAEYLRQLERLRDWPLRTLHPAHGAPLPDARLTLEGYLTHRRQREQLVLRALEAAPAALEVVAARAYPELPGELLLLATLSTHAHLLKLEAEGFAVQEDSGWRRPEGE